MNKKAIFMNVACVAISMILMGCSALAPATPTANPDLIYTAAAQTADVRLTQIFRSTPSGTPITPSSTFDLTQTAAAQTASVIASQTAAVTLAPQATATFTPVPTGASGDRAVFVSDVTIPDGTVIAPGAAFVKTWKLQNGGVTTWTTAYSLVFISGAQMGTTTSVPIPQSVPPGQQIDVSVNLVAPTNPGTYQGYWKMKNASGQLFNDAAYVLISDSAGGTAQPTSTAGASPTSTSTGTPSNPINSLGMAVDTGVYSGTCPHTFNFAATLNLNQSATLTYRLDAGSDTPGFSFNLPSPQTSVFGAGTYYLTFPLTFTSTGAGWVKFHVTSPVDMASNQEAFTLTCKP